MQSNEVIKSLLGENNKDFFDFEVSFRDYIISNVEENFKKVLDFDGALSFYKDSFILEEELKQDIIELVERKINFRSNQSIGYAFIRQGIDIPKIGTNCIINNFVLNDIVKKETNTLSKVILEKFLYLRSLGTFNKTLSRLDLRSKNILRIFQVDGLNFSSIIEPTVRLELSSIFRRFVSSKEQMFVIITYPDLILVIFYFITGNLAFLGKDILRSKYEILTEGINSSLEGSQKLFLAESILFGKDINFLSNSLGLDIVSVSNIANKFRLDFSILEFYQELESLESYENIFGRIVSLKGRVEDKLESIYMSIRCDLLKMFYSGYLQIDLEPCYVSDKVIIFLLEKDQRIDQSVLQKQFSKFLEDLCFPKKNVNYLSVYFLRGNLENFKFF